MTGLDIVERGYEIVYSKGIFKLNLLLTIQLKSNIFSILLKILNLEFKCFGFLSQYSKL